MVEERIAALDARTDVGDADASAGAQGRRPREEVPARLAVAERPRPAAATAPPARPAGRTPPVPAVPSSAPVGSPMFPKGFRGERDLDEFLGGSVLAWLGGVAVLAGLAFLLTIGMS